MKVIFSRSNTFAGRMIRLVTRSKWNHVDMVFDNHLIGAVALHATPESINGGVQLTTWEHRLKASKIVEYIAYDLPLADEQAAFSYALEQVGKPYDWKGAAGLLAPNRNWEEDTKWFCSELAAAVALQGGVKAINRSASRIDPGMFELSPFLIPIIL